MSQPVSKIATSVHHIGLAARDYDATVDFYTRIMGFDIEYQVRVDAPDGSEIMTHVLFDIGNGTLAFMIPAPGSPAAPGPDRWTTDINSGLGVFGAFYHFALSADSIDDLERKQEHLRSCGVQVTEIDYKGVYASIYFRDPNGILFEFCYTCAPLTDDHKLRKTRTDHVVSQFSAEDMKIINGPSTPLAERVPVPTA